MLRKGIPIDLHESVFTPGKFAMTGLHHTPVLLHCTAEQRFELYAMRTFALDVWEWLEDAAKEYTLAPASVTRRRRPDRSRLSAA